MPKYYLTNDAENDLREILEYTLNQWGVEQVLAYRNILESRLRTLAKFPTIGRNNINLPSEIFYIVEGKHYLFYRIVNDEIEVLRILHSKMDIFQHISNYL